MVACQGRNHLTPATENLSGGAGNCLYRPARRGWPAYSQPAKDGAPGLGFQTDHRVNISVNAPFSSYSPEKLNPTNHDLQDRLWGVTQTPD
jgi:hypothetical protein